jgi:hypothetical protein
MRRNFLILLVLGLLGLPAVASPEAMVTRLTESGEVVVNRGVEDDVKPGTRWFIYRDRQAVAEVEVELVDSYSSKARVVQGGGVRVGDRVTDQPFQSPPVPVAEQAPATEGLSADEASARVEAASSRTSGASSATVAAPVPTAVDAEASYQKLLAGATRTQDFAGGARASNEVRIDPLNTANMFTTFGYGGQYWYNIWDIASVVGAEASRNVSNSELYKNNKLQIQVTYWSDALLEGYADSLALRENRNSVEDRLAMRANLYAQKGLDRYVVFNVKLSNQGPGTVQLSPFHWHMYLVDAQNNRVKAERYDQVLDRTLNPDQSVEGTIYFLKTDVSGRPLLGPGKVKVVLEDVLGDREEMTF